MDESAQAATGEHPPRYVAVGDPEAGREALAFAMVDNWAGREALALPSVLVEHDSVESALVVVVMLLADS
jgi:hypothetical protein